MSLINKMNVGNTDYDIQDRLMPDAIGQAGQVLKVKDDGSGLEFSTIESGGGKLYKHYTTWSKSAGTATVYAYLYSISSISTKYNINEIGNKFISGFHKDPSTFYPITRIILNNQILVVYYIGASGNELQVTFENVISDVVTEL